ncbi:MAG: CvpA family protein [Melioribacteraceae bacterium]|nr:CvpA family protein [Melioribacteraceae bacterium]
MNYLDIIILIILLIGFALGFRDGLIRKVIGLLGLVLGVVFALQFYRPFGKFISPLVSDEIYLAEIVAGFVLFVGAIFLASLLKRIIHPLDKVNRFTNQLLGAISGTLQILFFISGFFLFLNIFNFPSKEDRNNSFLYTKVYNIIPVTIDLIIGSDSDAMNLVKDFIEKSSDVTKDK